MNKIILLSSIVFIFVLGCKKDDSVVNPPGPIKPSVKITSLQNNSIITDIVSIEVEASDDKGIVKVELYIDNKTDSSRIFVVPPYSYLWDARALSDGSPHIVYAKAYDADNNVESSEVINVTVRRFQPSYVIANLKADTAVVLSWTDNCIFETGYEIERGVLPNNGQASFSLIRTLGSNVTQAVIEGNYSKDTSYAFRIRAVSHNEKSLYSNEVVTYFYINAPSNLKIISGGLDNVRLTWTPNSSFPTQYEVEYKTNDGEFISLGTTLVNSMTVSGLSLTANDYSFRVRAKSKYNLSSYSNVITAEKVLLQEYHPVRIYESVGTTVSQPAGLILSTGSVCGIGSSNPDRAKIDLYYSSSGFVISSADNVSGLTRQTFFKAGSSQNLKDGVDSPEKDATWVESLKDTENNYIFVLDNDNHYSKLMITGRGGGTPGNPAWLEVTWIYNKKAGSRLF